MDFRQHTIHLNVKKEYKQFIYNVSITFWKNYQDETKCQQFLRKEMQALQKRLFSVSKLPKQQNTETGRENNILQKFIRKFHEPLPSYDKVIEQWTLTEEFKERYEK